MSPLERLRAAIPMLAPHVAAEYAWLCVAFSVAEARELLAHVDQLEARVAELEAAARRCADCGRGARELKPWFEDVDRQVWLGPGCWRKREQQARHAAIGDHTCQVVALPIGGGR